MTHQEIDATVKEWEENGAADLAQRVPLESNAALQEREKLVKILTPGAQALMRAHAEKQQRKESERALDDLAYGGNRDVEQRLNMR